MKTNSDQELNSAVNEILSQLPEVEKPKQTQPKSYRELFGFADAQGFRVTSTTGGRHNRGSKHYTGQAIDVGTREKSPTTVNQFITDARARGYRVKDERQRPERIKRGELPIHKTASQELTAAQTQLAATAQRLDTAMTEAMVPATKGISQLTPLERTAAMLMEHANAGKVMQDIPTDATIDQAKELYQRRLQDFGADSVSAADAWEKVKALASQPDEETGRTTQNVAPTQGSMREESQSLLTQHQEQYQRAIKENDFSTARRSLRQVVAQVEFQLQQEPATPSEV